MFQKKIKIIIAFCWKINLLTVGVCLPEEFSKCNELVWLWREFLNGDANPIPLWLLLWPFLADEDRGLAVLWVEDRLAKILSSSASRTLIRCFYFLSFFLYVSNSSRMLLISKSICSIRYCYENITRSPSFIFPTA